MISKFLTRSLLGLLAVVSSAATLRAQNIPSPAQAQQMLRNDPSMISRLQQMMQSSGLTQQQIRDRLRAAGYPESLLDQYLGGSADSLAVPGEEVFEAVRALGIADSTAVDSLTMAARSRRRTVAHLDSAFLDTLQRAMQNDSTRAAVRALLRSKAMQQQQIDSGFRVFGLDLFEGPTSLFDVNSAGGVDPNYRFGPGDKLVLFLTGDVEKSYPLTVTREGFVVIPDVGQVNVSGLTRAQLEDLLYSRLGRVYSGISRNGGTTRFYINASQIGTNQIFVNGDVDHPGSFRLPRTGTALNALYLAGGPTPNGSLRNVQVRRAGQTVATLDFYDYALRGDASGDVRLESGDVVFVPPRGPQVRVAGRVLRPAIYELKANQTVADVVRMAGGFAETADTRRLQIERVVPANERTTAGADRRVIDVPSDLFESAPVRGGDVILVNEIARRVASRVTVKGNVWSPGAIGYTQDMTLTEALRRAGGLKPDTYLGEVLVARLRSDSTRGMLRAALVDTLGNTRPGLTLADGDEITVFSTTTFRPNRYISIGGAVRKPGRLAYREGMTLHDAVLLADGLAEGALLTDAEIARLPEERAAGQTAVTQTVPLDSTYLVERGPDGRWLGPPGISVGAGRAPEVILQPYDVVLIKRQPDWQLQRTVSVQGEVKSPGDYALRTKTDRLADIVQRAGGLTNAAYADGIVFVRRRGNVGRIGVDLPAALRNPSSVENISLADGDSIFIPQYSSIVIVRGEVNSPTGVPYVPGADIDFYVRAAGGAKSTGDRGHAYVTQASGKMQSKSKTLWVVSHDPKPLPGSTVTVPVKDPTDRRDWPAVAAAFTSILGSLITLGYLIKR